MNDGSGWGDRQLGHDPTPVDVAAAFLLAAGVVWLLFRWGGIA